MQKNNELITILEVFKNMNVNLIKLHEFSNFLIDETSNGFILQANFSEKFKKNIEKYPVGDYGILINGTRFNLKYFIDNKVDIEYYKIPTADGLALAIIELYKEYLDTKENTNTFDLLKMFKEEYNRYLNLELTPSQWFKNQNLSMKNTNSELDFYTGEILQKVNNVLMSTSEKNTTTLVYKNMYSDEFDTKGCLNFQMHSKDNNMRYYITRHTGALSIKIVHGELFNKTNENVICIDINYKQKDNHVEQNFHYLKSIPSENYEVNGSYNSVNKNSLNEEEKNMIDIILNYLEMDFQTINTQNKGR